MGIRGWYDNVYTSRQLSQLLQRALGQFHPDEKAWQKGDGVVDPFRPTIEPHPFSTVAELDILRQHHLEAVADLFRDADIFVFTLGLTEMWEQRSDGAAFPLCPGTAGGSFDPATHAFRNLTAAEIRADMEQVIAILRRINPNIQLFITVSPVPLMATATQMRVAVATTYSKAVLRTVAGELYDSHSFVDDLPAYEIFTASVMKGYFFQPDAGRLSSRKPGGHASRKRKTGRADDPRH